MCIYKHISFFLVSFISLSVQSQSKKWSLDECVKYAVVNNIAIKTNMLDLKTTEIDKKAAIANFIPSINSSVDHSWNIGLNIDPTSGILRNQTSQYSSMGMGASFDIYKGLQNQNQLRRANLSILAAKFQITKIQEDIALNVANAYLQVLFNKESLKIQHEQKSNNEKQLIRSEELVKAGSIPRGDLLDIKATLASDDQKIIAAENALLISKLSLAQLLQIKDFNNFDIQDETVFTNQNDILTKDPLAIYEKAKEGRIEFKIAKTNLEMAEKDVSIAKGGAYPSLKGVYNFNSRISYADFFDPITKAYRSAPTFSQQLNNNKGQTFGLQLSIPIFNGFNVKNNINRAKVNLEKSKFALEQEDLTLQRNVYTAFTDAKGSLKSYESAITALVARQEALNYSKERYAVGMMNSFDFNQSQTLFAIAQSEVIRSKYDYLFKIKILEFYFGIPIINK